MVEVLSDWGLFDEEIRKWGTSDAVNTIPAMDMAYGYGTERGGARSLSVTRTETPHNPDSIPPGIARLAPAVGIPSILEVCERGGASRAK